MMNKKTIYLGLFFLLATLGCKVKKIQSENNNEIIPGKEIGSSGSLIISNNNNNEEVEYITVRAADGKVWLQQNLGSLRVASNIGDKNGFGYYFQWGRGNDGHEKVNSPVEVKVLNPNNPRGLSKIGDNPFYASAKATGYWWNNGDEYDSWTAGEISRINEVNGCDPCKELLGKNWRVPTIEEWKEVLSSENVTNLLTAYTSNLKLLSTGMKNANNGLATGQGKLLRYWSNTAAAKGNAYLVNLNNKGLEFPAYSRGGGLSVRCVRSR